MDRIEINYYWIQDIVWKYFSVWKIINSIKVNRSNSCLIKIRIYLLFENNLKADEGMNISYDSMEIVDSHFWKTTSIRWSIMKLKTFQWQVLFPLSFFFLLLPILFLFLLLLSLILPFSPALALSPDLSSRKFNEDKWSGKGCVVFLIPWINFSSYTV